MLYNIKYSKILVSYKNGKKTYFNKLISLDNICQITLKCPKRAARPNELVTLRASNFGLIFETHFDKLLKSLITFLDNFCENNFG